MCFRKCRNVVVQAGLVWLLTGLPACSWAASAVNFVVDGRAEYNVAQNDMGIVQELISGVGNFGCSDWKAKRIKEFGFKRIQIINAFNASAYRGIDGKLEYDWSEARKNAKWVIDAGAEPKFVISCATPRGLSSRPNDPHYHSYPPANWDEYEDYVYQTMRYFNVTLAPLGYRATYWDVQNEPDHTSLWFPEEPAGSKVRYENVFQLYRHTVKAVEKYELDFPKAPRIKIGGLRFTSLSFFRDGCYNWIEKFLADCKATNTRVDHIAFHFYGAGGSYDGHSNWADQPNLQTRLAMIKGWIKKYSPKTELHMTEWGAHEVNHTGSVGVVNGNNAGATFAAAMVKTMLECGVKDAYFLSIEDRVNPPSSGLERNVWEMEAIFTYDGHAKAIANTFRMFKMMAPKRVSADGGDRDTNILASRDDNRITLMFWNHNLYGKDVETAEEKDAEIEIRGLPGWKSVTCRRYLIDETHSNAYYYRHDPVQMVAHEDLEELPALSFSAGDGHFDGSILHIPTQRLERESVMFMELMGRK